MTDTADPEVQTVAWDLADLLHDAGTDGASRRRRRRRAARRGPAPRGRVRRGARGQRRRARRAAAWSPRCASSPSIAGAGRPRRLLRRRCASRPTPPTPRAARCCSACRSTPPRSRRSSSSSSSSGPRSTTSAPRSCSPTDGLDFAATTCAPPAATGRTCSPSPRRSSSTEKALTGRSAWARLFDEQTSAIEVDARRRRASPSRSSVALSRLFSPDREVRRTTAEARHRGARARPAHPRLHLQHAARRQGGRRPPAQLPELARAAATSPTRPPTSPSRRSSSAVRGRYEIAAPLVPPEGAAARPRPPRRLRPHGRRDRRRRADRRGRRRATLVLDCLRLVLPRARRPRAAASSTSAGSTRRCAPASAAARSAPTRCRPCTRT